MADDLAAAREEVSGDVVTYRFANGLVIKAEVAGKDDRLRILPLTRVQSALLNYLLNSPTCVRGKRVFEPFAGSGAFAFMARKLGARHVDLLDINPRAGAFHLDTTLANGFPADSVRSVTGDFRNFPVDRPYDLLLANPPFLPTPDCVKGTLSSNGGMDGNRLTSAVLERLDELLRPNGEALMILYQIAVDGVPLLAQAADKHLVGRDVEFTPLQQTPVSFESYCAAYERQHPSRHEGIRRWKADILRMHGDGLTLSYYVMHIGPRTPGPGSCTVRDNAALKFGERYLLGEADPDYAPVDGRRR